MALDVVTEECLHGLDEIGELEHVRLGACVLAKIEAVRAELRGEGVLDWRDLEVLESVRAVVRLCKTHDVRVEWVAV
jgi:hypothetical protein